MMKWALIGYGGMGGWHVEKLQSMPELFEVAGIFDIAGEAKAKAEANGLRVYESLDALWADAGVELVTVATPNDAHMPLALAVMKHGKHVICEKPAAPSLSELERMTDAGRDTGRLFTAHMNRRWDKDFLIIQKLLGENAVGDVFSIESRVQGSRGVPGDWRNEKRFGGGMMLDWGVHLLDQILLLTGESVVSVYCRATHVTNDEVDDGFKAILTFESGRTAEVEVGTSHFVSLPRWYVCGENGTILIEDWKLNGKIVKVSDWGKRDAVPVATAAGLTKTMAPRTGETVQTYPLPMMQSDVRDFYRNVKACIEGGETQLITHRQLKRVARLLDVMRVSAEYNETIHARV